MEVFKVKVTVKKEETFELFFNTEDLAQRFVNAIKLMFTEQGQKELQFELEIIQVITSINEIVDAFIAPIES